MQRRLRVVRNITLVLFFASPLSTAAASPTEGSASGPPAAEAFDTGQRNVAVIADFGFYSGSGLGARLGTPDFGIEATFGYLPILRSYVRGNDVELKFASSYDVGPSIYWLFWRVNPRCSLGLLGSYKYDNLLGHGGGAGVVLQYELSRQWALRAIAGYVVFPDAESRLRAHWDLPNDGSLNSGIPWLEGGVNAGFAFFP
jgi:hypothetical protein